MSVQPPEKVEEAREFVALCRDIENGCQTMKQSIENFIESVKRRSALIRPFVNKDFEKGTGMTPEGWMEFLSRLLNDLHALTNSAQQLLEAHQNGSNLSMHKEELAASAASFLEIKGSAVKHVRKLQEYLAGARERVKSIPAGFLSEKDRVELVEGSPERAKRLSILVESLQQTEEKLRTLLA